MDNGISETTIERTHHVTGFGNNSSTIAANTIDNIEKILIIIFLAILAVAILIGLYIFYCRKFTPIVAPPSVARKKMFNYQVEYPKAPIPSPMIEKKQHQLQQFQTKHRDETVEGKVIKPPPLSLSSSPPQQNKKNENDLLLSKSKSKLEYQLQQQQQDPQEQPQSESSIRTQYVSVTSIENDQTMNLMSSSSSEAHRESELEKSMITASSKTLPPQTEENQLMESLKAHALKSQSLSAKNRSSASLSSGKVKQFPSLPASTIQTLKKLQSIIGRKSNSSKRTKQLAKMAKISKISETSSPDLPLSPANSHRKSMIENLHKFRKKFSKQSNQVPAPPPPQQQEQQEKSKIFTSLIINGEDDRDCLKDDATFQSNFSNTSLSTLSGGLSAKRETPTI